MKMTMLMWRRLLFVVFILLLNVKKSFQGTHWLVTEDGRIEQQLESVFNMRKPYDLVAFMRQEEEVHRLKSLQKELLEQKKILTKPKEHEDPHLPETFYENDLDCLAAKRRLAELNLHISTVSRLEDRGYRLQDYIDVNHPPPVAKPKKPYCSSELPYSMYTFEHLEGMSRRHELRNISEPSVINAFLNTNKLDALGHQIKLALDKKPTHWLLLNLAAFYWRIKGYSLQAVECLRRALHHTPRQYQDIALLSLANVFHNCNFSLDAVVLLHVSLETTKEYVLNYFTLGNIYASLNLNDFAIKCYKYVLEDDPGWWEAAQRLHAVLCEKKLHEALKQQHRSLEKTLEELEEFQNKFSYFEKQQETVMTRQRLPSEQYKHQMEFLDRKRDNANVAPTETQQNKDQTAHVKKHEEYIQINNGHVHQKVLGPDGKTHTLKFKIGESGVVKFGSDQGGGVFHVQSGSIVFTSANSKPQTLGTPVVTNSSEKENKTTGKKKQKKKGKKKKKKNAESYNAKTSKNVTVSSNSSEKLVDGSAAGSVMNDTKTTNLKDNFLSNSTYDEKLENPHSSNSATSSEDVQYGDQGENKKNNRMMEQQGSSGVINPAVEHKESQYFCEIHNLAGDSQKKTTIAKCGANLLPKATEQLTIDNVMLEDDDEKVQERCKDIDGQQSVILANKHISMYLSVESKGIDISKHVNFDEDIGLVMKEPHCTVELENNPFTLDHLKGIAYRDEILYTPEDGLLEEVVSLGGKRRGSLNQIGTYLARALEKNATSWVLCNIAALYWRVEGKASEAVQCLRTALYFSPSDMKDLPLISLSSIFLRAEYLEDAVITIKMALEISPRVVVSHFTLGNILAHQGNVIDASHHYLIALEYEPTFTLALERLKMVQCVLWKQQKELETESAKIKKLLAVN